MDSYFRKTIILVILTLVYSADSFAYGAFEGYVTEVRVQKGGNVLITFDRDVAGSPPACAADRKRNMAFSLEDVAGNGMLSTVLTAQSTGKALYARGLGTCNSWSTIEDGLYFVIKSD